MPRLSDVISAQGYDLSGPPRAKSPSGPLSCPLPEASLKDVISETRRATAERGANHAGEKGDGEEGHGEEGNGEEGNGEEGNGEEGHGPSFDSARRGACASGRNAIASRIHADRARPVG